MQLGARDIRAAVMVLALLLITSCRTTVGVAVSPADYPFLTSTTDSAGVKWRRIQGSYGDAFFGRVRGDKSAALGFHRYFEHPGEDPGTQDVSEASRRIEDALGAFEVMWHQTTRSTTPHFARDTSFDFRTYAVTLPDQDTEQMVREKMYVWISADEESQVSRLSDYLGSLELFRVQPDHSTGIR